ncbi:GATA transcription factor 19-like [Oryza brachyantha]|uniref:GATA transcription factor 19-like n=1 Tax=Oryza brachyantha TaxID=4533 RepID=UPI0003EAA91F|nr:GATA transcription factor 19-like [Oryza brachyantha]
MDRALPSTTDGVAANGSSDERHRTSPAMATAGVFEEYPFFSDIVIPFDLFLGGLGDDDCNVDDQAASGQQKKKSRSLPEPETMAEHKGGLEDPGGWNVDDQARQQKQLSPAQQHGGEERLVMYYRGREFVFDSVQPQKIENIILHLNGEGMIPQSIRPHPTNLVRPIAVPENFDRFAALTRYREKKRNIKFITKADYSARRQVALRMKRSKGKFAPTVGTSEVSLGSGVHRKGITFCTNCGESSDATPMMRHGPNGTKTFCNACGLMWANSRKIRKIRNQTSKEQADLTIQQALDIESKQSD